MTHLRLSIIGNLLFAFGWCGIIYFFFAVQSVDRIAGLMVACTLAICGTLLAGFSVLAKQKK